VKLTVAGLQSAGRPGDVLANLAELDDAARSASADAVDLLVTPELFLTGYDIGDAVVELAGTDLLGAATAIARRHRIALIVGAPEQDPATTELYNTAYFIGADGTLLDRHRKAHLFGELDRKYFAAGDEAVTMIDYRGVKVAVMICYDVEFPEYVRRAALAGAHLVAVPTAQMEPFTFVADHVIRTRAWENQIYVAYINHDGRERDTVYVGRSSICGPDATVLDRVESGSAQLRAVIDTDVVDGAQRANPYLLDRRPTLYPHPADLIDQENPL
jgi:5-aminopentanamidase